MKLNITLILSIIIAVGLVAYAYSAFQISTEREKLNGELRNNTINTADDFYTSYLDGIETTDSLATEHLSDSVLAMFNFTQMFLYYNQDRIVPVDSMPGGFITESDDYVRQAIAADSSMGNIISVDGKKYFQYTKVVKRDQMPSIAVVFFSSAQYIENILHDIRMRSFIRWFLQSLLIAGITIAIVRWGVLNPVSKVIDWVKAARFGNLEQLRKTPPPDFLAPVYKEISGIAQAVKEARAIAQQEAKLRTTAEAVWTPERLNEEMKIILNNRQMVVVSNREPYMHVRSGKEINCIVPASGMVTAMEPILKACGGLWIASGSGDADKETVDENDKVMVPPFEKKYTLKRIWLTKEQESKYYYGFANEGLWPLCHIAHTRPVFRTEDWNCYIEVNEIYAKAVIDEIKGKEEPFILVQDYHFALLPALIKSARPDAKVAIFWHIPWPNPESFNICPWQKELLTGMLGADLIGFHTQYHCNNFLETVNNTLESRVIWENFTVKRGEQLTLVKPFPISIAFTLKDFETKDDNRPAVPDLLRHYGISGEYMGIGVDRIDYTKGLTEKFLAIERFLEKYPEYINKFTFVQIGAPSRALLKSYSDTLNAVDNEVNRINWKLKTKNWQPILYLKRHHSHEEILPFYRAADFCMITSLHDGMNLVAKEFIAARDHNDGTLILSRFAGASQELHGALLINPYDIEQSAEAIHRALTMDAETMTRKMKQMRRMIMSHNVYSWAAGVLKTMAAIEN